MAAEFLKFHCIRFHFYEGESLLLYIIYFILKFITTADVTKNLKKKKTVKNKENCVRIYCGNIFKYWVITSSEMYS